MLTTGPKLQNKELEDCTYSWIIEQQKCEMLVSTTDIIDRELFLDLDFKVGNENKRIYRVLKFHKRRCLSDRTRTHVS